MKNKGFTLIELLGVMIILALLLTLIFPNIINFIKDSTNKTNDLTLKLVYTATESYIKDNSKEFSSIYGNKYCISLNTLVENNYLKGKQKYNGKDVTNSMSVQVNYTDKFNYELVENNSCEEFVVSLDTNLIPVVYDGEDWIVADTTKEWYNYENQEWANAVILRSGLGKKVGDTISVDGTNPEALAMFVWIPRFEYKIEGTYGTHTDGTAGTKDLPGEIKVNFISRNKTKNTNGYRFHPAFTFGLDEVSGIWVGKFELSHITLSSSSTGNNLSCSNEKCESSQGLRILPNVQSLRYNNISNFFYGIRSISKEGNIFGIDKEIIDTHMMKNSEWGAVAYLSQSKYGKYGNPNYTGSNKEIYINGSSTKKTGSSNGVPSNFESDVQCEYNDATNNCGVGASTTGNIYGVYDMSGGAAEYVMGVFVDSTSVLYSGKALDNNSGFKGMTNDSGNIEGLDWPNPKYYNVYKASSGTTITSTTACNEGICYGHALSETANWYGDNWEFVSALYPWFLNGGASDSKYSGVFNSARASGNLGGGYSTRAVLTINNK